jgi:hypothetical protein
MILANDAHGSITITGLESRLGFVESPLGKLAIGIE